MPHIQTPLCDTTHELEDTFSCCASDSGPGSRSDSSRSESYAARVRSLRRRFREETLWELEQGAGVGRGSETRVSATHARRLVQLFLVRLVLVSRSYLIWSILFDLPAILACHPPTNV
jgi:hypothetical protein